MKNKKLAKEILEMARLDQEIRKAYTKNPSFSKKLEKIDRVNLPKMKRIVNEFGWPTTALVGKKASALAWLLVQHADNDIKFQEYCLKLIKKAAKDRQILEANIAYLTDRILVNKGKPQIYGTQFYKDETGKFVPRPIKNMKMLDKMRKKMGLGTFELYKKKLEEGIA